MSIKIMSYIWEHSQHSGTELLMLLALADSANDEGITWPSLTTLAAKCRMKKRQAIYLLQHLEKAGSISIEHGRGRGHVSVYRINGAIPCTTAEKVQLSAPITAEKVQLSAPITGRKGAIQRQKGAVQCTQIRKDPEDLKTPCLTTFDIPQRPPPTVSLSPLAPEVLTHGTPPPAPISRMTRQCPPAYLPSRSVRDWAQEHYPQVDFEEAVAAMRDHTFAHGRTDWDGTLRNWIREDARRLGKAATVVPISRAKQRAQENYEATLQLDEIINGQAGPYTLWEPPRPTGQRVSRGTRYPDAARLLAGPPGPAP